MTTRRFFSARSNQTAQWLRKQLRDPFVKERHARQLRSRSALKVEEAHHKFNMFKDDMVVVDLGASPGGWLEIARDNIKGGRIIGVDLKPILPIADVQTLKGDFTTNATRRDLRRMLLPATSVDLVLSDMAPNAIGERETDHFRQIELCYDALNFALTVLPQGDGAFFVKVFNGAARLEFESELKSQFHSVKAFKPKSSRPNSQELFMFAKGLKQRKTGKKAAST